MWPPGQFFIELLAEVAGLGADQLAHYRPPSLVKIVVAHSPRAAARFAELDVPRDRAEDQR